MGVLILGAIQTFIAFDGTLSSWWTRITIGVLLLVFVLAQRLLTIGRVHCDVNFSGDPVVSERHAQLTNEGTHVTLEDLKSRNGTYFRVRHSTKLLHGDLILIGDQVLRIELPQR